MKVIVVDYNVDWAQKYIKEEQAVKNIVQDELVNIFHIGSTSVPKLKAKPIIDILLVVKEINRLDQYAAAFENLGYEVMGEFGIVGRRYFRKGGDNRTHQIHVFQYDAIYEIERHLTFRDYLRAHPEICAEYGELKSELAAAHPEDIDSYGDGKEDFIRKVEREALQWHWQHR